MGAWPSPTRQPSDEPPAGLWHVMKKKKKKCSILTHVRGDTMGVFLTNKKPTGQMETEEETLWGN